MIRRTLALAVLTAAFVGCTQPPSSSRGNPRNLQEAERALLQEQFEKAAGLYEAYLAENPGDAQRSEVRTQAGKCRLAAGHPEQAIRAFDQALADQPSAQLRWEILFRRAVAYRIQGDGLRAIEGFRIVSTAPVAERGRLVTNDEFHYEYATALFRVGDFKSGQLELKQVNLTGPYEKQLAPRLGLSAYTIQVGAFGTEADARAVEAKLNGSIRQISGPRTLFQVVVGSFIRYDEAQRELTRLQRQGYTDAFILP
jgi:cell division septation protein DedD